MYFPIKYTVGKNLVNFKQYICWKVFAKALPHWQTNFTPPKGMFAGPPFDDLVIYGCWVVQRVFQWFAARYSMLKPATNQAFGSRWKKIKTPKVIFGRRLSFLTTNKELPKRVGGKTLFARNAAHLAANHLNTLWWLRTCNYGFDELSCICIHVLSFLGVVLYTCCVLCYCCRHYECRHYEHAITMPLVRSPLPRYVGKHHLWPHHVYTVCGHIHTTQSNNCRRAAVAAPKDGPANMIFGESWIVS